jgi:phospholipase/carboxylesterase
MLRDHRPTEVHDRNDVLSPDMHDPAGVLMEYATDGPGMTVDEAADDLGPTLFLPWPEAGRAADLEAMLPQFALPGGARIPARDDPLIREASTLVRDLRAGAPRLRSERLQRIIGGPV